MDQVPGEPVAWLAGQWCPSRGVSHPVQSVPFKLPCVYPLASSVLFSEGNEAVAQVCISISCKYW